MWRTRAAPSSPASIESGIRSRWEKSSAIYEIMRSQSWQTFWPDIYQLDGLSWVLAHECESNELLHHLSMTATASQSVFIETCTALRNLNWGGIGYRWQLLATSWRWRRRSILFLSRLFPLGAATSRSNHLQQSVWEQSAWLDDHSQPEQQIHWMILWGKDAIGSRRYEGDVRKERDVRNGADGWDKRGGRSRWKGSGCARLRGFVSQNTHARAMRGSIGGRKNHLHAEIRAEGEQRVPTTILSIR